MSPAWDGAGQSKSPVLAASPRDILESARDLLSQPERLQQSITTLRSAVEAAYSELREEMVRRELSTIPIGRLRESTAGRLRLGAVESAGFTTVGAVMGSTPARLQQIPGVGEQTAIQTIAAARQVAEAVRHGLRVRIDLDPNNQRSTALIAALWRLRGAESALQPIERDLKHLPRRFENDLLAAARTGSRLKMFFSGSGRRSAAEDALGRVRASLSWASSSGLRSGIAATHAALKAQPSSSAVWADFAHRAADYYSLLGQLVDLGLDVAASEGFLSAEIVARVNEQKLDDSFSTVSLRGYQSFGARFALVQRRVIIGDEMGLGKTIQAIAAFAHLRVLGNTHFLVVCPASVLINWLREVAERSALTAYGLHGPDRQRAGRIWAERGGVAVTTFESLRGISVPPNVRVAMFVVDEAHYVKNPAAQRSRTVATWAAAIERVLFLTGTPMENRVDEFRHLVDYLQPSFSVRNTDAAAGAHAFRRSVAPVYLRRNQEDVLTELPDLVSVDEWEELSPTDRAVYTAAVRQGNFMAMRRAAFASGDRRTSAKLQRLLEIADEAGENGHKVVVFSYFRDVLDTVHQALGPRAFGPLTGDVTPVRRQELVDAFTRANSRAVLVSQIQAGGVGLNIQAASVVILCEPQVKPTMETQAIARAYRMGQVRRVQVHRLLAVDTVDQRMLEILAGKTRLFDEYARPSDMANSSPDAVDISEIPLAREVVAMEQERLAREAMGSFPTHQDAT